MEKKYHIDYNFINNPVYYGNTLLVQLGRCYCMPLTVIEKHAHINWYEITVVTDGEGIIITNDREMRVEKGDIYVSYPGDFHEIRSSRNFPLKYDFFAFNTKNQVIKSELKKIVANMPSFYQRVIKDEKINTNVASAIAEFSTKKEYYEEVCANLFEQTLLFLIRNLKNVENLSSKKHITATDELCFQIMHYIDTHIYSIESLTTVSEKFRYNYSYLSNIFKQSTGNTLSNYYQTRRLDAARLLLNEGELKVNEIADMLKYSSLYAFSKAFKQKYGISPKFYAEKMKK